MGVVSCRPRGFGVGKLGGASIFHPPLGTYRCRPGSSPAEAGAGSKFLPTLARARTRWSRGGEDWVIAALPLTAATWARTQAPHLALAAQAMQVSH